MPFISTEEVFYCKNIPQQVSAKCSQHAIVEGYAGKANGAGTAQVNTATVVGTVVNAGNATVTVTLANPYNGLFISPKVYQVPVAAADTATQVAGKIAAVLQADATITALFTVTTSTNTVVLTCVAPFRANDTTLNIAIANGTCTGLTAAPTSVNTTPGVSAGVQVLVNKISSLIAVLAFVTATGAPATKTLLALTTDYTIGADNQTITYVTNQSANTLFFIYK
jgi:phage tail sheath gpL-like